jgi:Secretion system C-terminal sorting domain
MSAFHMYKSMFWIIVLIQMFSNVIFAQTAINTQRTVDIIVATGSSPNNPAVYQWQEISNTKQGVHISVIPTEVATVYIQKDNSVINFHTWNWGYMVALWVGYDGGNLQGVFSNSTKDASGWLVPPFSSLGHHTISIKWIDIALTVYYRSYDVYVVPTCTKFYKDSYGNTLTSWEGSSSGTPIIISEGFDAYNNTYSEYLRYKGQQLFDPLISAGYRIYFLNYYLNSQDMRNSAAIYNSAARYISSICSNTQMVAAGVSMGGVIVRYALTKAENDGAPLPFKKFISIDGPQQGAIISYGLQSFIKNQTSCGAPVADDFTKFGLNNDAAKQLLTRNPYENTAHSTFYSEMQSLNGGIGYPRLTKNIGVTFSNGSPNPNSGHWLDINYSGVLGTGVCGVDQSFDLTSEEEVAGSYFPTSLIQKDKKPLYWGWEKITVYSSPTFIPYTSSLDLVNGTSKFDTVIQSTSNHFHDEFPPEIVGPLLSRFISISPSASISGPTSLKLNQTGNYTATASYGISPYHYEWFYMHPSNNTVQALNVIKPNNIPVNVWFTVGFDSPTLTRGDSQKFNLKCVVTDATNTQITSNILSVSIGTSPIDVKISESRINHDGNILTSDDKLIKNYSIENYPNPFNPTTVISYQLPENARVSLKVYDILGREVATLVDGMKEAGAYTATFDGSRFASGMYFARFIVNPATAGSPSNGKPIVQVKKMLMIK